MRSQSVVESAVQKPGHRAAWGSGGGAGDNSSITSPRETGACQVAERRREHNMHARVEEERPLHAGTERDKVGPALTPKRVPILHRGHRPLTLQGHLRLRRSHCCPSASPQPSLTTSGEACWGERRPELWGEACGPHRSLPGLCS